MSIQMLNVDSIEETSGEFMVEDGKNLARKNFLKISVLCGVITIENMLKYCLNCC